MSRLETLLPVLKKGVTSIDSPTSFGDRLWAVENEMETYLQYDLSDIPKNVDKCFLVFNCKGLYRYTGTNHVDVYSLNESWGTSNPTWNFPKASTYSGYTKNIEHTGVHYLNIPLSVVKNGIKLVGGNMEFDSVDCYSICMIPEITTFDVIGTSVDNDIQCNISLTDANSWTLIIKDGDSTVFTKTGSMETSVIIPKGTLTHSGSYVFELTAVNGTSVSSSKTVALTAITPKIVTLEPDGISVSKDEYISISWVSENQSDFELNVNGNVYKGTTGKSLMMPGGTIKSLGQVSMTLTIKYTTSNGVVRTDTKTVTFTTVGIPRTPQLDNYDHYTTATPTFTWVSLDAVSQYRVQILENSTLIDDSGDVVSVDTSYTCQHELDNNKTYTVKLKVRTDDGYWSEWTTKTFTTDFVVANKPVINVYASADAVLINSDTKYSESFDHCDIYRKRENEEWVRIGYNFDNKISLVDKFVGKGTYYYKVTSVSTAGGINDSEVVSITISISDFNFLNVENVEENIVFVGNPIVDLTINRKAVATMYAGVVAPVIDVGEEFYITGNCSFTDKREVIDKFIALVRKSKVILYRDGRGNKVFCHLVGNLTRRRFSNDYEILAFSFTQVSLAEKDMYTGQGNLPIAFFDGTYYFDSSILFDGEGEG